jgi:ferredoxin
MNLSLSVDCLSLPWGVSAVRWRCVLCGRPARVCPTRPRAPKLRHLCSACSQLATQAVQLYGYKWRTAWPGPDPHIRGILRSVYDDSCDDCRYRTRHAHVLCTTAVRPNRLQQTTLTLCPPHKAAGAQGRSIRSIKQRGRRTRKYRHSAQTRARATRWRRSKRRMQSLA